MSTPHINAKINDFAETVLFPGDPLRAKYIAHNFLTDVKEVTSTRNILGFSGKYKGEFISVIASGMGIPSCNIYATELITKFNVKNIIRIGTSGGLVSANLNLNDIVIPIGACTDSNVNRIRFNGFDFAATCSFDLLIKVYNTAKSNNLNVKIGNCFTSDFFYLSSPDRYKVLDKLGILCLDMETAGLYGLAHEYKVNALSILTISDIVGNSKFKAELSAKERETGLNSMINLALESVATHKMR